MPIWRILDTNPNRYKAAYFIEYIKRQRRKAWDVNNSIGLDERIVANNDEIARLKALINQLENENQAIAGQYHAKSSKIIRDLSRFERLVANFEEKTSPPEFVYYDLRTTDDDVDNIFSGAAESIDNVKGFERYLLREGYFKQNIKLQPGVLIGVSNVTNPKTAIPRFTILCLP